MGSVRRGEDRREPANLCPFSTPFLQKHWKVKGEYRRAAHVQTGSREYVVHCVMNRNMVNVLVNP